MKRPFATKEQLEEIIGRYPTPFHIYDERGMRENARRLKRAFAWNEGYREYFAVKAAPTPGLLKVLLEEGCGLDCSSYTELMMARAMGCKGDDIMFSSNVTPKDDYLLAHELGAIVNLDDYSDIDDYIALTGVPERICCRFNPGGEFRIRDEIMDTPKESKYGFTRPQLFDGFKKLVKLGVREFGLHAFLASNTQNVQYYPNLAKILFKLAVELKQETGANITFINLSGGVGIPYKPDAAETDIMAIGEGVRRAFERILVPAGMGGIKLMTELGRFMTGPYGALVSRVIHIKRIHKDYLGLDACAANLMRPAMYGAYHHITVMGKEDMPADKKYDVTGGLCENNDKFAIDRLLPETEIGDLVYIHDTGAHGFSMGYNYNGKLRSAELLLKEDGSVELIRRAETPEDYFATFDCTGLKF